MIMAAFPLKFLRAVGVLQIPVSLAAAFSCGAILGRFFRGSTAAGLI